MSKSYSGLFHGTIGTTYINGTNNDLSYSDRGIELPDNIKNTLSQLKQKGDIAIGNKNSFSMKDVSAMSKETGVEYAKVTIGDKTYLIRGDKTGAMIPDKIIDAMIRNNGTFDFHTHPHNDDCIPSGLDRKLLRQLEKVTGQKYSKIVTPNGKTVLFNKRGVIETGNVENTIDDDLKKVYMKLFGGK